MSITLFRPVPDGPQKITLAGWSGTPIFARSRKEAKKFGIFEEASKPAVYFLIHDTKPDIYQIYIGEADNFLVRIGQHSKKTFWNKAIAFFAKELDIAGAHYLELAFFNEMIILKSVEIMNENTPAGATLDDAKRADMDNFKKIIYEIFTQLNFDAITPSSANLVPEFKVPAEKSVVKKILVKNTLAKGTTAKMDATEKATILNLVSSSKKIPCLLPFEAKLVF